MQKYPVSSLLYILLAVLFISCSKMDDTYKEYVVPGGIIYVGKADSVKVYPGRERLNITWLRGTDPNTREAVIYWNNKADSLVLPVKETSPKDVVTASITNLPENSYTFSIYTRDNAGNSSIRVDVQGISYGQQYESSLLTRPVNETRLIGNNLRVIWLPSDSAAFRTEVIYIDKTGVEKVVKVPFSEDTTLLENYKEGASFRFRTLYLPTPATLDTFYTGYDTRAVNLAVNKTVKQSSGAANNPASLLIDQDKATFWQPLAGDRTDDKHVWITIDLKSPTAINEVKHFWKTGGNLISGYKIFGSDNETTWQQLFEKTGAMAAEETASFADVTTRYVKLDFTIGTADGNLNITEVEVYKR